MSAFPGTFVQNYIAGTGSTSNFDYGPGVNYVLPTYGAASAPQL